MSFNLFSLVGIFTATGKTSLEGGSGLMFNAVPHYTQMGTTSSVQSGPTLDVASFPSFAC